MTAYSFSVNGRMRTVESEADMPLLYALRNNLGLTATKFGCGLGQCGACTVIMDGQAVRSCSTPMAAVAGTKVTTLEGLGTPDRPHPVQAAFIAEQAAQCGYCINGMVMTSAALLDSTPSPDLGQIRQALAGNLCRCGTHQRILQAVARAAGRAMP